MTTAKQDGQFIAVVISDRLLEESIEWIGKNLDPEDVFSENALAFWAEQNGFERE